MFVCIDLRMGVWNTAWGVWVSANIMDMERKRICKWSFLESSGVLLGAVLALLARAR